MSKAITFLLRFVFYMLKKFVWNVRNLLSKSFLRFNLGLSAFSEIAVDVSGERKKVYFRIFSSLSVSMHLALYASKFFNANDRKGNFFLLSVKKDRNVLDEGLEKWFKNKQTKGK